MLKSIALFIALTSFFGFSQSENWELYASQSFLPSAVFNFQYYSPAKKERVNNFHSRYKRRLRKRLRKERESVVPDAITFLKAHLHDSVQFIPLESFDCNSADFSYLKENGLIKDSNLILNFNLFARQASKAVKTCDNCLPTVYFEGHQIDGQRLKVTFKEDSISLLELNIGISERSRINNFQEWTLLYKVYHKYGLFGEMKIESYFSRKRLSLEITRYIDILKR